MKISLSCSGIERLVGCDSLRLVKNNRELKRVSVIRAFLRPDGDAVVSFKEVQGVEEAETLRGSFVAVPVKERVSLPEGQFFIDDLMGLKAVTITGEELGIIEEVLAGPANGICVVRRENKESLIPFIKTVVRKVDLESKTILVDLPEEIDAETTD